MLEIVTRAPIAAILRENYPVAHRGHVTATVRQWCSLIFLIVSMLAATILQYAGVNVRTVASIEIIVAAVLGLSGFACFRKIPIRNDQTIRTDFHLEILQNVREIAGVVIRDARYRRFLIGCALEVFFMMLYLPLVPALLSKTLKFDYVWCALLLHGIPTLAAFITTGWIGQWFDRTNPWISWFTVRFAFGLDALLLAATPLAAYYISPLVLILPILARLARGAVQGGWWILWWQIGITHFAPPGEDTSRYAGIMIFLNGIVKIAATAVGMTLMSPAFQCRTETLLWIGGLGIIASGAYSLLQAFRERKEHRPQTFAEFEAEFDAKTQPTAPPPSGGGLG